jgi:hypothetical protein
LTIGLISIIMVIFTIESIHFPSDFFSFCIQF